MLCSAYYTRALVLIGQDALCDILDFAMSLVSFVPSSGLSLEMSLVTLVTEL